MHTFAASALYSQTALPLADPCGQQALLEFQKGMASVSSLLGMEEGRQLEAISPLLGAVDSMEFQAGAGRILAFLASEGHRQLVEKADRIARLVVEVTPPPDSMLRERTARLKTIAQLFAETEWFSAQQIHELQPRPPKNPSAPASDWKRRGKIFAVAWDGKEYYPAYQFSEAIQPLPVIAEVLAEFGAVADTWQIATWFHFPNGWLASPAGEAGSPRARSPRECLAERDALLKAVRQRLGSYQA